MKALGALVTIFIVIVLVVVLGLGYLGFIPGVSTLMGSDKPRDLGVSYTANDFQNARAKTGTVITDLPTDAAPAQSIKFSGQKAVSNTFTQAEFNALLNKSWTYYPFTDCQLKINPDGTEEMSGILRMDRVAGCAQALGFSDADAKTVNDYLKAVPGNPPFYVKGNVEITNNQIVNSNITDLQIGKLSVPIDQIESNRGSIIGAAQTVMSKVTGLKVNSFKFVNGQAQFDGALPNYARSK